MIAQYKALENTKKTVNARAVNSIQRKRKLRLASFVAFPRLVKGFHNNPIQVTHKP